MKRLALVLSIVPLVAAIGPARSDPGHERPRITVMRWQDPPVTATEVGCEKKGTCSEDLAGRCVNRLPLLNALADRATA